MCLGAGIFIALHPQPPPTPFTPSAPKAFVVSNALCELHCKISLYSCAMRPLYPVPETFSPTGFFFSLYLLVFFLYFSVSSLLFFLLFLLLFFFCFILLAMLSFIRSFSRSFSFSRSSSAQVSVTVSVRCSKAETFPKFIRSCDAPQSNLFRRSTTRPMRNSDGR